MRFTNAMLAVAMAIPVVTPAQQMDSLSQQGRRIISVGLGVTSAGEGSVSASGQVTARATGAVGSIAYIQFVTPTVAVNVAATALDAGASVSHYRAITSAISAMLVGLSYSPRRLILAPSIRPYVTAALGPYFRSRLTSGAGVDGVSASTESRIGGRFGGGANFYLARHFALVLEGDYDVVGRFTPINGTAQDASGFSLTIGLGVTWGR